MERPSRPKPIARPAPRPPLAARPKRLERHRDRDARARSLLDLMPPARARPCAARCDRRGSRRRRTWHHHSRGSRGLRARASSRTAARRTRPVAAMRTARLRPDQDFPGLGAIWWPRFERAARGSSARERERREDVERVFAEANGAMEFDAGGRPFRLTARADRFETPPRRRDCDHRL